MWELCFAQLAMSLFSIKPILGQLIWLLWGVKESLSLTKHCLLFLKKKTTVSTILRREILLLPFYNFWCLSLPFNTPSPQKIMAPKWKMFICFCNKKNKYPRLGTKLHASPQKNPKWIIPYHPNSKFPFHYFISTWQIQEFILGLVVVNYVNDARVSVWAESKVCQVCSASISCCMTVFKHLRPGFSPSHFIHHLR